MTILILPQSENAGGAPQPKGPAIPKGRGEIDLTIGVVKMKAFTYRPKTFDPKKGLLLVFHGADRNAKDYRDAAIPLADRRGCLVVAPYFDKDRFNRRLYMWGGLMSKEKDGEVEPREKWTWQYVPKLVALVRAGEGRPDMPYYLLGHSGGGQFVERMAGFLLTDASRIVAANPGTHLFPTKEFDYPYGFGGFGKKHEKLSDPAALKRYLAQPLTLYLGTADTKRDKPLDVSDPADKQGANRYERGRNAFNTARRLAENYTWEFNWRLVEAKGVGHDEKAMFEHKNCETALFGR